MNELNPKLSEILTQFEFYCWVLLLFQFNLYNICSFTTTCVPLLSFWKESSSFCSYFPVFFPLRGFAHLLLTQTNLKGVTNCQIHFLLLPELAGIFDTLFFSPSYICIHFWLLGHLSLPILCTPLPSPNLSELICLSFLWSFHLLSPGLQCCGSL